MKALLAMTMITAATATSWAQVSSRPVAQFTPVPELAYQVVPDFFQLPAEMNFGEASGVALDSRGHIYLFHRAKGMLAEFDNEGKFLRTLGDGLFDHPHGLRIDKHDNIWTT